MKSGKGGDGGELCSKVWSFPYLEHSLYFPQLSLFPSSYQWLLSQDPLEGSSEDREEVTELENDEDSEGSEVETNEERGA